MVSSEGERHLTILFRTFLFLFSTGTLFFVLWKIRHSQVQIGTAVFWILFMLGLVVISIFPIIVTYASKLFGIVSPANFVFLCVLFVMLIKNFHLSLQLSKLHYQMQVLTQMFALEVTKSMESNESAQKEPGCNE